ncbi:S41 family peptidase [Variovorax sp. 54]|uniref:S41 family peptidase n=1 Tax=Variovorax sp. 54 TaxID=2035212 RepID=UPI0015D4ED7E|nr:S41 family peptidase [Variovorax sp. 54]
MSFFPLRFRFARLLLLSVPMAVLVACGGGGDAGSGVSFLPNSGTGTTPPPTTPPTAPPDAPDDGDALRNAPWVEGVFRTASLYKDRCAAPRTGTGYDGKPFADKAGRTLDENNWLRAWVNDTYLWYDEVPDLDPARYATADYFDVLKTHAVTPSGRDKDQFHFTYTTEEWNALSRAGSSVGYGAQWAFLSFFPPRDVRVAYVEPGSPAATTGAGLPRGAQVLKVNGVDLVNDDTPEGVDALNAAIFSPVPGTLTRFTVLDVGSRTPRDITLPAMPVISTPVQNVKTLPNAGRTVGYLQFNDHIGTAELQLKAAMEWLRTQRATELVVDLRYNGGGYLDLASQLAFMVAGEAQTRDKAFETTRFNNKHTERDPVSGEPILPTPFWSTTSGLFAPADQPLPSLDLRRVYVLTGPDTCSASEAFINGLRGIDIDVVQIGDITCGKPYGFYPQDNCGTTYFSVQFQGVNAKGFGDYPDGLAPTCFVPDDFSHALGDSQEARLAAALAYQVTGACPAVPAGRLAKSAVTGPAAPLLRKPEGLRNRILRPR